MGSSGKARGTTKSENRVGRRRRIGQSVKEDEMAGRRVSLGESLNILRSDFMSAQNLEVKCLV